MALQPFTNKQLNYFKFASVVLNEFAIALRQTFKSMWDNRFGHRPGYQLWDNSTVVRNLFLAEEGGKSKVPTHISYEEWDCTVLFKLPTWALSWLYQFSSFKIQSHSFHHQVFLQRFHTSLAVRESVKTLSVTYIPNVPGLCRYEARLLLVKLLRQLQSEINSKLEDFPYTSSPCEGFFQEPIWLRSFWASLEDTPQKVKSLSGCP